MPDIEWVEVNGARIDKRYLDENIEEAKNYEWASIEITPVDEHAHCMICNVAIPKDKGTSETASKSVGGHLCGYCHETFLVNRLDEEKGAGVDT